MYTTQPQLSRRAKLAKFLSGWTAFWLAIVIGLLVGTFAGRANAQEAFSVAGGSKTGTYSVMLREFVGFCGAAATGLNIAAVETNGSVDNINLLTDNKVNAALVQSDLLFATKQLNAAKVANVKTVFALHPEELHFIARSGVKQEGGYGFGKFKVGGDKVTFNTLDDLSGRSVGAVGGSLLSGRVVSQYGRLNLNMVDAGNNDALKAKLLDGEFDAILVVGGAQHPLVASLDNRYKLLPISPELQKQLKDVYQPATINYSNLGPNSVSTLSTQALFVTREYRSQAMLNNLAKLRACFVAKLGDIQDKTGTHAKWQAVSSDSFGTWPAYQLPAAK